MKNQLFYHRISSRIRGLLIILLCSFIYSIKPMDWSHFEAMPVEIKLGIFKKLLEDDSIVSVMKNLHKLRRVNKEFYGILSTEEELVKPFQELDSVIESNNIFTILNFIKNNPAFLRYHDLSDYLQTQFNYHLTARAIKGGLYLLNYPIKAVEYIKRLGTPLDVAFQRAIEENNIDEIFLLLILGINEKIDIASTEKKELFNNMNLVIASMKNNIEIVKLMLDTKKFDVNFNVIGAKTPLMAAIDNNDSQMVNLLLENGASPNLRGYSSSMTPLAAAVSGNKLPLVELLLKYGANANQTDYKIPLIIIAAGKENIPMVHLFLKHGADVSPKALETTKTNILQNPLLNKKEKDKLLNAIIIIEHIIEIFYPK